MKFPPRAVHLFDETDLSPLLKWKETWCVAKYISVRQTVCLTVLNLFCANKPVFTVILQVLFNRGSA